MGRQREGGGQNTTGHASLMRMPQDGRQVQSGTDLRQLQTILSHAGPHDAGPRRRVLLRAEEWTRRNLSMSCVLETALFRSLPLSCDTGVRHLLVDNPRSEIPIYGVDTDVLSLSCRRFRPTPRRRLSGLSHPSPIPGPLALSVQRLSTLSLPGGKFGVLETVQPFPVEKSQGSRHKDEGLGPQIPAVLLQ